LLRSKAALLHVFSEKSSWQKLVLCKLIDSGEGHLLIRRYWGWNSFWFLRTNGFSNHESNVVGLPFHYAVKVACTKGHFSYANFRMMEHPRSNTTTVNE